MRCVFKCETNSTAPATPIFHKKSRKKIGVDTTKCGVSRSVGKHAPAADFIRSWEK